MARKCFRSYLPFCGIPINDAFFLSMDPFDVAAAQRKFEGVGIARDHLMDHVDLLQHPFDSSGPG
jgi:hypothetical protein